MGLQTKTFTLAGQSFTAGTFTSVSGLLGATANNNIPEGYNKCIRVSMSCSPNHDSATDGISVFKIAGDGAVVQQLFSGPSWSNSAAGPLCGNNGMPVVIESATGVFDVNAGNALDISMSVTTAETCDVSISLTYSA